MNYQYLKDHRSAVWTLGSSKYAAGREKKKKTKKNKQKKTP